jgi:hypothetical protein
MTTASSTTAALDGQRLTDIAPAFQNGRVLRTAIAKVNKELYPDGDEWKGKEMIQSSRSRAHFMVRGIRGM